MGKANTTARVRTAAWAAAQALADKAPDGKRRAAGPSAPLSWVGITLMTLGIAGTVAIAITLSQPLGAWVLPFVYLALAPSVLGIWLLFWAAPDAYLTRISRIIRSVETFGRRVQLTFAALTEVVVLGVLFGVVFGAHGPTQPGWLFITLLVFATLGTAMAVSALSSGAAIVSVTSNTRGHHGRRAALLIFVFGVCTVGAVAGAGLASHFGAPAVWPSVVLAVLGIVLGVLAQQNREVSDSIDNLEQALAALYIELRKDDRDEPRLWAAAMGVESTIAMRSRGPLSIPPLSLVDEDLRVCMSYLLAVVTELPFNAASKRQAAELVKGFHQHEPAMLLADLAWEIRRRLFLPVKVIDRLDARAFNAELHPQVPAPTRNPAGTQSELADEARAQGA